MALTSTFPELALIDEMRRLAFARLVVMLMLEPSAAMSPMKFAAPVTVTVRLASRHPLLVRRS